MIGPTKTPLYLMGDNFLRNKLITVNLKEQTISIIKKYNCTYTQYVANNDNKLQTAFIMVQ